MAQILLTHTTINSGSPVLVLCKNISIGYKKNTTGSPNENFDGDLVPRRIAKSIDVPTYNLTCTLDITNATVNSYTVMTQALLKDFITLDNDDSDPLTLNIIYGSSTQWKSIQKVSSVRVDEIPCMISGSTIGISASDVVDGAKPSYTLTIEEVREV